MTIANVTDLTQRCQDWLFGRADIAARVPDFITLFEAKANRALKVRQMESRVVTTVDLALMEPEFLTLPADFHSMRQVRLLNPTTPPGKPRLRFAAGGALDDLRTRYPTAGQPIYFGLFSDQLELVPTPNFAYRIEMIYRTYIPPLGAVNATNWLLSLAPDAYLYGTLMEAAPYLHDDERIGTWSAGVSAAFQGLNDLNQEALYNAGPLVMRRKGSSYS